MTSPNQTRVYKEVVKDVLWVLERMLDKGKKRAAEGDVGVRAKRYVKMSMKVQCN
jgi:hypothetical protein